MLNDEPSPSRPAARSLAPRPWQWVRLSHLGMITILLGLPAMWASGQSEKDAWGGAALERAARPS